MGSLYQDDVALWSSEQASALRTAASVGSNRPIDWENVVEEQTRRVRKVVDAKLALYEETPAVDLEILSFTEEQVLGWHPDL